MNITSGIIQKPVKTCIYAVEGIGKSTFASHFPKPLFLDLDKGTARLDVDRVEGIHKWYDLISTIKEFVESRDNPYETLVIDTADAAARLCERYIVETKANGKRSIEDIPYGRGYKMLAEEFSILLVWLEAAISRGYNVVIIAHAIMRAVTKPDDMGSYDHWELKLPGNSTNKLSPFIKEWADLLLFADYKTRIVEDSKTGRQKAVGGDRIMYASHTAFADAKNRFGLPDRMPFDYGEVAKIIPNRKPPEPTPGTIKDESLSDVQEEKPKTKRTKKSKVQEEPKAESETLKELRRLMAKDDISQREVEDALMSTGQFPAQPKLENLDEAYIRENLINKWAKFSEYVKEIPF